MITKLKVLHVDLRWVEDDKLVDVTGELDASDGLVRAP